MTLIGPSHEVVVFNPNGKMLEARETWLLHESKAYGKGITGASRFVACDGVRGFAAVGNGETVDKAWVQEGIIELWKGLDNGTKESNHVISLGCTELPPGAQTLREKTGKVTSAGHNHGPGAHGGPRNLLRQTAGSHGQRAPIKEPGRNPLQPSSSTKLPRIRARARPQSGSRLSTSEQRGAEVRRGHPAVNGPKRSQTLALLSVLWQLALMSSAHDEPSQSD